MTRSLDPVCRISAKDEDVSFLPCGLADVDVPLHSQHQGEVDAGVVEHLGYRLREHLKEEAGGTAPVHVLVTGEKKTFRMFSHQWSAIVCHPLVECVGVDKPGCGAEDHQEVTHGDGRQDRVGGGQHLGSEINSFQNYHFKGNVRGNVFVFSISLRTNCMLSGSYQLDIVHHHGSPITDSRTFSIA